MIGNPELFGIREDCVFLLVSCKDNFDAFFEVCLRNRTASFPDGAQGSFVDDVGQLGTGSTGSHAGDYIVVDILVGFDFCGMNLEDFLTSFQIGKLNRHAAVKSAWSEQCGIQ